MFEMYAGPYGTFVVLETHEKSTTCLTKETRVRHRQTDRKTDRKTDGRTDGRTDRHMDGSTEG